MPTASVCRVCGGALELLRRGGASGYEALDFNPSCHRVGEHHDLYRCVACGTVDQPSLPRGAALHDLYRGVSDERYLLEERGRRRTATRLLDLLGGYVERGRLLQVGCSYGLLLDEARRRGYEVEGVEVASEPARYARERLGLPVREMAIEEADLQGERYDAILLVDVLEHLDEPVAVLDRLLAALSPGGAVLIVTPDPASLVARAAGGRWWCFVPAHAGLIPRLTLRELLVARNLEVCEDRPSVHTFTLRYWLAGLGERGGPVGRAVDWLVARVPRDAMFTASLHDERELIARPAGTRAGVPEYAYRA